MVSVLGQIRPLPTIRGKRNPEQYVSAEKLAKK